jgi:membrane protease YdiL (CAAX protease family)
MWFVPQAKTIFALLPIFFILLIERRLRKRSWSDLGFKFSTFWKDLRANWFWFILVGLVSQIFVALWAKSYFPAYLQHVQARLPFGDGVGWAVLIPLLAVFLFGEELTYRTLIQGRLTTFVGTVTAIIAASILFGLTHFAPGAFLIVLAEFGFIFIDSILFGIIYARSNNVIITWSAHLIGDILGLLILSAV